MESLLDILTSSDPAVRHRSLAAACAGQSLETLLDATRTLDDFRRQATNLYQRVRALFFLAAIHRYEIPPRLATSSPSGISSLAYRHLLERRFAESIDEFLRQQAATGPSEALSSGLAQAYRQFGFQTLADQVRQSVRQVRGNQWMFRLGHPLDSPLTLRHELRQRPDHDSPFPVLRERTAVRLDFSHSAWSDIFFLGMDFPDGARVLNVSIDLGVAGQPPQPPIESFVRVIDRPVLRLTSVDLGATVELTRISDLFDFGRDHLGLLKAAVIAAGIVPPGMEGSNHALSELLDRLVGPGLGLEVASQVYNLPKGSRLAVSTNLLGSLISLLMRATGQIASLTGPLTENDRRIVAARAILGEWLGSSGGGWQDSGGVWPGIKLIHGVEAQPSDPEWGISRGSLLPRHRLLGEDEFSRETRGKLQDSLVLVHGGLAQNVGPILEMVTEKYLLRGEAEWQARSTAIAYLDEILAALRAGDLRTLAHWTTLNFSGPLQSIIPWTTNRFTDLLIERARERFGADFWGFLMLGGMAGGGMGFLFDPACKAAAHAWLAATMSELKQELEHALPFAMEPVVFTFAVNDRGTWADLLTGEEAALSSGYYSLLAPQWLLSGQRDLSPLTQLELRRLGNSLASGQMPTGTAHQLLQSVLPRSSTQTTNHQQLQSWLHRYGFDERHQEQLRSDLRSGRIGLAQNRLPPTTLIEPVEPGDYIDLRTSPPSAQWQALGTAALEQGQVAVISLAAGAGSRWTEGAGVVKALHPFCKFRGRHRNFLEVHLAKSRRTSQLAGRPLPHVFTTGYLTDEPIRAHLEQCRSYDYPGPVIISTGRSVGLRTIPMTRDLRFEWENLPQQTLDPQREKLRASQRAALLEWARQQGEGNDYVDNLPQQCLHPVGHWYEVPNLLLNGTLAQLLTTHPQLQYLLLHNVDTLGAHVDPGLLGAHIASGACLTFEVIQRRVDDRGGGLARVNGQVRILEGLAMPHEDDEFRLPLYNSMTTWIHLDTLLDLFALTRSQVTDAAAVSEAVRRVSRRIPTYVTLKDVKKRWGRGQEDIFPVAQYEQLWSDMTSLPELTCGFIAVPILRGQQLKHPAQLDGWLRDGSAHYVDSLCDWQ
jgi:hypothetical protein